MNHEYASKLLFNLQQKIKTNADLEMEKVDFKHLICKKVCRRPNFHLLLYTELKRDKK